jgi:hypothetical protein
VKMSKRCLLISMAGKSSIVEFDAELTSFMDHFE